MLNAAALSVTASASAVQIATTELNSATAQAQEALNKAAATPKDDNNWTGDHLQIRGNMPGLAKAGSPDDKKYFAPAYVRFEVAKDVNGTLLLTPRANFTPPSATNQKIEVSAWRGSGLYGLVAPNLWGSEQISVPTGMESVQPYDSYTIGKEAIENIPYVKYGWTYGALLVPFKYQSGSKAINASNSLQMYVGYKRDSNGTAEGPFVSAGLASADVATGTGTSSSKQGFSFALGWLFDIKKGKGFQVLVMAGQDKFGANSGYQYEGEVWYSVSMGLSLDPQAANP